MDGGWGVGGKGEGGGGVKLNDQRRQGLERQHPWSWQRAEHVKLCSDLLQKLTACQHWSLSSISASPVPQHAVVSEGMEADNYRLLSVVY